MAILTPFQIWKMCGRKRGYDKESSALNELRLIRKTGKIVPENSCAYKCLVCGKFHLGHSRQLNKRS